MYRVIIVGNLLLLVAAIFIVALPTTGAQDSSQALPILKNRGFENEGNTSKLAKNWTLSQSFGVQRVCNKLNRPGKPDLVVSHTGKCAFRFVGKAGRTTLLTQVVAPGIGKTGDTLYLSGFVQSTNLALTGGVAQLRLIVNYQGGGSGTRIAHITAGTYEYTQIEAPPLLLNKKAKKLRVQVRIVGGSGKFFADTLNVVHVPASQATQTPTATATIAHSPTPTLTYTPSFTPTLTFTPTITNTPTNTNTPTYTNTPS